MKHINIVLPQNILQAPDRVSQKAGKRSLLDQLEAGYEANAKENVEIALDWFPVDLEAGRASPARQQGRK